MSITKIFDMINRMVEQEPLPKRLTDIMVSLNDEHQLGLTPQTIQMAKDGEFSMRFAKDISHDWRHYQQMGVDTGIILEHYPDLVDAIDWNAYVCAVSFHDQWRSSLSPRPWNLLIGEKMEPAYAPAPAKTYMTSHGFPQEEIEKAAWLIKVHTYGFDDSRRMKLESNIDPKLKFTGRLMYVVDSLDVFQRDRIDAMITYISHSFGGVSLMSVYKQLANYYQKHTNYSFNLGKEYPWIPEEAARRRGEALAYIQELVTSKRDVRGLRS